MKKHEIFKLIVQTIKSFLESPDCLEAHRAQNKFVRNRKLSFLQTVWYLFFSSKASMNQNIAMINIPISFRNHFYASTGRTRKSPLQALLWALIIQRIFSIPTDQLLLTFLSYSKPLREFCGFTKVPDASKITRFKQDFLEDLQLVFDNLVDVTEPICQAIDAAKADMTIFDSCWNHTTYNSCIS